MPLEEGAVTDIGEHLQDLKELGLYRRMRTIDGIQGPHVVLDGRPVLLLCSDNYLGLAGHPRVCEAAADAALRYGAGAGASRLVSGTMTIHRRLEERLTAFHGTAAAVLFGSGYLANAGVVSALAGRDEVIFSDDLNHASTLDGCGLAAAETFVYRHGDLEHLEWGLEETGADERGGLIVTDSVFAMDGDIAPLEELVELARYYGLRLVVDEAHATGCLGPGGRGAVAAAGLEHEVDVVIGTLGAALGTYGAYAACSIEMAQFLVNTARPLIFSTAPSPPAVAGAIAALELLEEEQDRIGRLQANAATLRDALEAEGFDVTGPPTHIIPLIVGEADAAMTMCERAIERGVFAQAVRPPAVPDGTSRLRLAVMACHSQGELRKAARVLVRAAEEAGLAPARAPETPATPRVVSLATDEQPAVDAEDLRIYDIEADHRAAA
jgi:glycine C-acetyltransferase/8-amino-7-oxononanoate synthase